MKYIKLFEQADPDIRVGDYVVMDIDKMSYVEEYKIFVRTHIAKVENIRINDNGPLKNESYIEIRFILNDNETTRYDIETDFNIKFIKFSAHTIEEMKIKMDSEKYNL